MTKRLTIAALMTIAASSGMAAAPKQQLQNIILVSVDTLRADHLPAYGYKAIETPQIDSLARRGVRFDAAISAAPLTLPSHCSIFTGTYPPSHGVRDNGGFYLADSATTLAELLKARGFATGAFVGAYVMSSRFGLKQGFDLYDDGFDLSSFENQALDAIQRPGGEVLDRALAWIDSQQDRRFFAFIHLYDPHSPYEAPDEFTQRYRSQQFGLYDSEIAYVDSLIGKLIDRLGARLSSTAIVFTSDHGEGLGDHGEGAHGFFVYDETVRVPLIVAAPGVRAGSVVRDVVRTVDIMPTLVELAGGKPPAGIDGQSLGSLLAGKTANPRLAYSESLYAQLHYRWAALRAVRSSNEKFIRTTKPELYDLSSDPRETTNIYSGRAPADSERYLTAVERTERGVATAQPIDAETIEALQALGYAGASLPATAPTAPLADPKDKLPIFNLLRLASDDSLRKDYAAATQKLEVVIAEDASIPEAHLLQGNVRFKQGKHEEAIASYRAALAIEPRYYPALFGLGLSEKALGRLEDAEKSFGRLHESDPKNARALYLLGEIAAERGAHELAADRFTRAIAGGADSAQARKRLGDCCMAMKRLDEAAQQFDSAASLNPRLLGLNYSRALLAEARGDRESAETYYRREVHFHPEHLESSFNVGILLLTAGRAKDARAFFENCARERRGWAEAVVFLAKSIADSKGNLEEAEKIARGGVRIAETPGTRKFAHLVLADILIAMGRPDEAERELAEAEKIAQ